MMRSMVFAVMFVVVVVSAQQPFIPRPGLFNTPFTPTPFAPANSYAGALIPILDYSNEINIDGSYRYNFATADGKQAEESGYLKDVSFGKDGEPIGIQVVQGSYSYTAPDGTPIQVSYIADENGFQPTAVRISQDGRYNPALINPAVINPAAINPAVINPVLNPRANIFPNQFRNPYAASARPGRYNSAFHNNNNLKPYDANANNQ